VRKYELVNVGIRWLLIVLKQDVLKYYILRRVLKYVILAAHFSIQINRYNQNIMPNIDRAVLKYSILRICVY